jgi:hypothetical protein
MHRFCLLASFFVSGALVQATPIFSEGFDNVAGLSGWTQINRSAPPGTTNWFQGNASVFPAFSGSTDSYIAANFENADIGGNISNWLITPVISLMNGYVVTFYTRSAGALPDRLELRLNTSGTTNVGATDTSVGDFTQLLLTVNPLLGTSYPTGWTQFSATISGLAGPTNATLGFRYFVPDTNSNADYIGIDSFQISDIPEPGTAMLVTGVLAVLFTLRRRTG